MSESIQVEYDGNVYELNDELISWMLKHFFALENAESFAEVLDENFCVDASLMQDVRLILDEVEDSLLGD